MNTQRTSGKNLQTLSQVADDEMAYEIRGVSPLVPIGLSTQLIISSATRQRSLRERTAEQPQPRTARNYGGRKMRCRWQDTLKPWQVSDWYTADMRAKQLNIPLNTFISIYWEGTHPGSAAMGKTFQRGMKRMGQWFRDHGVPFAWIFVHENPDDAKLNSHLLVHVPTRLLRAFKAKIDSWFDALDGGVRVDPRNDDKRALKGQGTRLQYMAKGAEDHVCRFYGGRRFRGGQGPVPVKRAGVAQCLRGRPDFEMSEGSAASRFLTADNGVQIA